ncbi:MAG: sulfotransferase [Verrucomicrobiae bacterium]|nr:sulfotransferase [Verrucomicrobiae bacterium]MCP5533541.1 sulfotransferase [Akkermansiaceae bacterium]MCP5542497.1 sulfotransferase [Akkermansiaceae bacterium]MCP5545968.1 sulfotransferase [Akkermansiaceae bacterium]
MLKLPFFKKRPKPVVGFLVAGTQKGGTTALHMWLKKHRQVMMAKRKEVHFFDNEKHDWKSRNYDPYHAYFKPNPRGKLVGEATPIYMYWNGAVRRIFEYNPEMKFVISLRDPVARAYSHWNMERDMKKEKLPFWEALQAEERRARKASPLQTRAFSYLDRGFYARQLTDLWKIFPREQTLVIRSSELMGEPAATLGKVTTFLGIRPFENVEKEVFHARPYVSRISEREREFLKERLAPDIRQLEKLLGWDCSDWLR